MSDHQRPERKILPTLGLLPVIAVSAAVAAPAFAQTADVQLDTVNVQAGQGGQAATEYRVQNSTRAVSTAPLLNTPKTVQVITQRQIEERGAISVMDVLRTTPGVTLGTGEGGNPMGDRPFIRGYEASTDLMVDGVRSLARTSHEAFNIEEIEMVKGAAGVEAGRGSAGGSLNMVSKKARVGDAFTNLSATMGNASQKRASIDTNFALGDSAAARINLFLQDATVPGRSGLRDDKQGFAAAFTQNLGDATKLNAGIYYAKSEATPDFGVPMATAAYNRVANTTAWGTGTKADPFRPIGDADHEKFYGSFLRDFRENTNQNATVGIEHELRPGLSLSAAITKVESEQTYVVTRPTIHTSGAVDRAVRSGKRKTDTEAFQLALKGEGELGGAKHTFALGFETSRDRLQTAAVRGTIPTLSRTTLAAHSPWDRLIGSNANYSWGNYTQANQTRSTSLYFADTIEFNRNWQLNVGLRHEQFKVSQGALKREDDITSGQIGLVYKPAANGSIYASYSTSASPSGQCAGQAGGSEGAAACTLTASNDELAPEKIRAYELGTKWDLFDERLSVNAAVFRTEKTNARVADALGDVTLTGKNRVQGFELGAAGQITDKWSISAGYTFLDAKVLKGDVGAGEDGNRLHYIARHNASLWATYAHDDQLTLGGGLTYTGERYASLANTTLLPAGTRVDLMASYKLNQTTSLQLNVNNAFDKKLYDASHVGLFANVQAGRSVTLKVDYRF